VSCGGVWRCRCIGFIISCFLRGLLCVNLLVSSFWFICIVIVLENIKSVWSSCWCVCICLLWPDPPPLRMPPHSSCLPCFVSFLHLPHDRQLLPGEKPKSKVQLEAERKEELAKLLNIVQPPVPDGVDPKSRVCEYFRQVGVAAIGAQSVQLTSFLFNRVCARRETSVSTLMT